MKVRCFGWKAGFCYIFGAFYLELVVSSLATVRNTADGFHKLFSQSPPELTSFITGIPTKKQRSPFVFMAASSPSSCRISGTHSLLPRVVSFSLLD